MGDERRNVCAALVSGGIATAALPAELTPVAARPYKLDVDGTPVQFPNLRWLYAALLVLISTAVMITYFIARLTFAVERSDERFAEFKGVVEKRLDVIEVEMRRK